MMVTAINTDEDFARHLLAAGGSLVVIDFFATWCGPCRQIAPVVENLAGMYPEVKFFKVDVDKCQETAQAYQVNAMPTFLFIKNNKTLHKLQGANQQALEAKVEELVKNSASTSEENSYGIPGMMDLSSQINKVQCLNENDDHPVKYALDQENSDLYLESDCDPELLISVTFNQPVKLHSLKIVGHDVEHSPSSVKIFTNLPHDMDFASAQDSQPVQQIELPKESADGIVPLRFVKFQNVSNVTLFIPGNHGDEDETRVNRIVFIGKTVAVTNMSDFKRVAGKKGESH